MDIIKLLPEYIDMGVDAEELAAITQAALAQRIRNVKLSIAEAVVQARSCTLLDNLEGSHQALQRARQLQREYHHFYAEWTRLQPQKPEPGPEVESKRNPDEIGAEWQRLNVPSGPPQADASPNAEPERSPDGVGRASQ